MLQNGSEKSRRTGAAERDLVALGIAIAAILMFVGTGGAVMPDVVRSLRGIGAAPDKMLVNALLLNIALIIFGWRRYRELTAEITERRRAEEQARLLAETDSLTGCLNRRSISTAADRLMRDCASDGRAVAFIMVDLDNFKQVNDLNGHKAGDRILKVTAERITALLPRDSLLARLGGDEFACVMPFAPHMTKDIDRIAAQVIDRAAVPIEVDDITIEITISVGLSANHEEIAAAAAECMLNAQTLMHHADIAMYHAKRQGKDRYFWFEPAMENEIRFRNQLESGIRRGIGLGEFVPYYEQQVDLTTGDLVGFEMLARWKSPEFGLVNPDVFIPIAEELGLIAQLSESLIAQAVEDAKEWDPDLTLSVNISPVQLRDPWFSQKLLKLLFEHAFPPSRLDIEITESCLHENMGVVRSIITSLKNQGVKISLDDFGTGYASLSQLRSLPFDRLKIDRSFVGELSSEEASSKIIAAIVSLGDGLDMPITAEGIEDGQILEALKGFGHLKGQGYHYGRPEAASAVREQLAGMGRLRGSKLAEGGPAVEAVAEKQIAR